MGKEVPCLYTWLPSSCWGRQGGDYWDFENLFLIIVAL